MPCHGMQCRMSHVNGYLFSYRRVLDFQNTDDEDDCLSIEEPDADPATLVIPLTM